MKKSKLILPLATLGLVFGLMACGNGDPVESGKTGVSASVAQKITITAAENKTKLILGESVQLTASVDGVAWSSSAEAVATVTASGKVESKGVGRATIKATKNGYTDGSINIEVSLEKITITAPEGATSIVIGNTLQLSASKDGVTWDSSDKSVATVSNTGLVSALKYGTTVISAEKEGFTKGTFTLTVTRPAPTATLHMEDAEHFAADGWWSTNNNGSVYGPDTTPVYEKESASDGKCIAYFGAGDKETLTFTSSKATRAELVLTMLSRSSYEDLGACFTATVNEEQPTLLTNVGYTGGNDYPVVGISLGEHDLKQGNNKLVLNFLAASPYLDDLQIYATDTTAQIAVVAAPAMTAIELTSETSVSIEEGATSQITTSVEGVSYLTANASVATVDEHGLITAVAKGNTSITVMKAGRISAKVTVAVTEKLVAGTIKVEAESGTYNGAALAEDGEGITIRTTSTSETITNAWPVDAVLTVKFTVTNPGNYVLSFVGRAPSSGYSTTDIENLGEAIEVKWNNSDLSVSGSVSGRTFTNYVLGDVVATSGENTLTIKNKTNAPAIDFFKLTPKAA